MNNYGRNTSRLQEALADSERRERGLRERLDLALAEVETLRGYVASRDTTIGLLEGEVAKARGAVDYLAAYLESHATPKAG